MGAISIRGKIYEGVSGIKVSTLRKGTHILQLQFNTGAESFQFIAANVRVEIDGDVERLVTNNCAFVFGEVGVANIGNCLYTQGVIQEYNNLRGIQVNNRINVKSEYQNGLSKVKAVGRATVLKVFEVPVVEVSLSNTTCIVVLRGSVKNFFCGNSAWVLGNVGSAVVGNMLEATMVSAVSNTQRKSQKDVKCKPKIDWSTVYSAILVLETDPTLDIFEALMEAYERKDAQRIVNILKFGYEEELEECDEAVRAMLALFREAGIHPVNDDMVGYEMLRTSGRDKVVAMYQEVLSRATGRDMSDIAKERIYYLCKEKGLMVAGSHAMTCLMDGVCPEWLKVW